MAQASKADRFQARAMTLRTMVAGLRAATPQYRDAQVVVDMLAETAELCAQELEFLADVAAQTDRALADQGPGPLAA